MAKRSVSKAIRCILGGILNFVVGLIFIFVIEKIVLLIVLGVCALATGAFMMVVGIRILKLPDILIVTNDTEIILVKQDAAIKYTDIDSIIARTDTWKLGSYTYGTIVITTKSGTVYQQGDIEKAVATAYELNKILKERLIFLSAYSC